MQNEKKREGFFLLVFVISAVLLFALPWLYERNAESINGALLSMAKLQLKLYIPFSEEAARAHAKLESLHAGALSWALITKILAYCGTWVRFPLAGLLCLLGIASIFMGKTSSLVRKFNMESLLQNNAESFACLRPIVGRGKYLLSAKSYDQGLWCMAQSPLQFAIVQELLTNSEGNALEAQDVLVNGLANHDSAAFGKAVFESEKAATALEAQLGNARQEFAELSPCKKVLIASFMAYADGNKQGCLDVLDAVATHYNEKNDSAFCPLFKQESFLQKVTFLHERHVGILQDSLVQKHIHYELPFFMALLTRARKKGVLASSQFIWLRPLDRPLWYALHQCGGHTAWAEALAPWAHYMAEEKAQKTLTTPHISRGVSALHKALDNQGWLINSDPSRTYAEAEEEYEEYSAYDDYALQQEQF